MAEGATARLPPLTGSRNLLHGTFLAEQISNSAYDLVSASAKPARQNNRRHGAVLPEGDGSSSRRKQNPLEKIVQCTRLPALDNIDTLFKDSALGAQNLDDWPERSAPGTTSPDSDEEDDEFREWLKLPRISQSPRQDTGNPAWHLLLSSKSLRTKPEELISSAFVQILNLDPHLAISRVAELRKRRLIILDRYEDKREAFRKLHKLRSYGLQVQVVMDSGLPGDGQDRSHHSLSHRRKPPSAFDHSYTELFHRAGADRSGPRSHATHGLQVGNHRAGLAQWRSAQKDDFEQRVLPEDPVEAFFVEERRQERQEASQSGGRKNLLQIMMAKHRPTIQARSGKLGGALLDAVKSLKPQAPTNEAQASAGEGGAPPVRKPEGASPARKEACTLLRFFVFGYFGNEDAKDAKERDAIFTESIGQREQVRMLHRIWTQLDDDSSGRVDWSEFRTFSEQHIRSRIEHFPVVPVVEQEPRSPRSMKAFPKKMLQAATHSLQDLMAQATEDPARFSAALCEKLVSTLLGKKSSFSLEDMMKLIWLTAKPEDIKSMKGWLREFHEEALRSRVDAPPVLDAVEYEGLCSVFEHFDDNKSGEILFDELVTKGLIYSEQVEEYRQLWDDDGNGVLSLPEFCEMMCPVGFRATAKSEVGSLPDGRRVVYDDDMGCWKIEVLPEESMEYRYQRSESKEAPVDLE